MPCVEWFEEQSDSYRESVLPEAVWARVSVEAGLALGWSKYVPQGGSVSIEHYGASADYKTLFTKFGITTEAVVKKAKTVLGRNK
jgi:transketolase